MNSIDTKKTSTSGVVLPVSLFDEVDMLFIVNLCKARQIFVSDRETDLTLSTDRLYAPFTSIYQKFDQRRIHEINEFMA